MKKGQHSKKYFTTRTYVLKLLSLELNVSEATISKYIGECNLHAPFDENKLNIIRKHYKQIRDNEHKNRSEAISKVIKGENNPFYGKQHSEEAKKKISKTLRGKEAWNKGMTMTPHTEEWKLNQIEKIKEAHKRGCYDKAYNPETIAKRKQTCLEKYGTLAFGGKKRYFIGNKAFTYYLDSSWELIYYLSFCGMTETGRPIFPTNIVRNTEVSFEYEYNGEKHNYFPDFIVDGKFVEIKGEHLLGQNPYDHSMDGLFKAKLQCMIDNNVEIIKDITFYKELVELKFCPNFWNLFDTNLPFPGNNRHNADDDIWKCRVKNCLSPLEAWNDPEKRTLASFNRLVYGNVGEYHRYATPTPNDLLHSFSVMKIAPKVSEFKASTTIELLQKYAPNAKRIVDPFAGFGGRLEGCRKLGLQYYGFDIEVKNNIPIVQRDILSDYPVEKYDCLLTCPPYGDKEVWLTDMPSIKTSDEWIDVCLEKFACETYIFVVDEVEKYSKFIIDEVSQTNGLIGKGKKEKVVVIHKLIQNS